MTAFSGASSFELNASQIAGQAVAPITMRYEIEREIKAFSNNDRRLAHQQRSKPVTDALHVGLTTQRQLLVNADAKAKAIDCSLSNGAALTTFLNEGAVPIDNNAAGNAIHSLAGGRKNWLFVGSQLAGKRAAVLMSLFELAMLNGHNPWADHKNVLERLPSLKNRDFAQLLPLNWRPARTIVDPRTAVAAKAALPPPAQRRQRHKNRVRRTITYKSLIGERQGSRSDAEPRIGADVGAGVFKSGFDAARPNSSRASSALA